MRVSSGAGDLLKSWEGDLARAWTDMMCLRGLYSIGSSLGRLNVFCAGEFIRLTSKGSQNHD